MALLFDYISLIHRYIRTARQKFSVFGNFANLCGPLATVIQFVGHPPKISSFTPLSARSG
jgi:hypothetical protein